MLKNIFLFIYCCFLIIAGIGCSNNPLLPAGTIGFGAESNSPTGFAAFYKATAPSSVTEFEMIVERIEISATGDEWVGIHTGGQTTRVQGNTLETVGTPKYAPPGSYEGVRVWFGKNLRAQDASGNVTEWNDFDIGNPVTFSTRNGMLSYPFTVERGTQCYVIFQFGFLTERPTVMVRVSKFR